MSETVSPNFVDYGRHDVTRMLLDAGSNAYVDIYKMAKRKHDVSMVKLHDEYIHTEEIITFTLRI